MRQIIKKTFPYLVALPLIWIGWCWTLDSLKEMNREYDEKARIAELRKQAKIKCWNLIPPSYMHYNSERPYGVWDYPADCTEAKKQDIISWIVWTDSAVADEAFWIAIETHYQSLHKSKLLKLLYEHHPKLGIRYAKEFMYNTIFESRNEDFFQESRKILLDEDRKYLINLADLLLTILSSEDFITMFWWKLSQSYAWYAAKELVSLWEQKLGQPHVSGIMDKPDIASHNKASVLDLYKEDHEKLWSFVIWNEYEKEVSERAFVLLADYHDRNGTIKEFFKVVKGSEFQDVVLFWLKNRHFWVFLWALANKQISNEDFIHHYFFREHEFTVRYGHNDYPNEKRHWNRSYNDVPRLIDVVGDRLGDSSDIATLFVLRLEDHLRRFIRYEDRRQSISSIRKTTDRLRKEHNIRVAQECKQHRREIVKNSWKTWKSISRWFTSSLCNLR